MQLNTKTPHLPEAAIQEALSRHGAEAALALSELAANPALPRLARLLGTEILGRALADSPLDLAQAAAELAGMLPALERIHDLSVRPGLIGRILARSLPSFLKGMREIERRGLEQSLTELEALLPEAVRHALPRPFPEAEDEAQTLLTLLEHLVGRREASPEPGALPKLDHRPGGNADGVPAPQITDRTPVALQRGGTSPAGTGNALLATPAETRPLRVVADTGDSAKGAAFARAARTPCGSHPVGCEVEVPHLSSYPAGGAYLLALYAGLPLGEDELVEFSLPPSLGGATQVRLIDSLAALGLLPEGLALSLHITCETPQELADSGELAQGMSFISFTLAYLWSADRRLAAGQIFKNFRLKHRGITGLRWPAALGAEYRLTNVCTAPNEPGVLGDPLRAHEAQIGLAERLHAALIGHCLGRGGAWEGLRAGIEAFVAAYGLEELVRRERNVTGELATLYRAGRTDERQGELLGVIEKTLGTGELRLG